MVRMQRNLGAMSQLGFTSLKLNSLGVATWAVISVATGAIAADKENRLLMRLTQTEANRIAAEMTAEAKVGGAERAGL